MRLLIDISSVLFNKIKDSIDMGKYPSLSDFFAISAENQLMLEKSPPDNIEVLAKPRPNETIKIDAMSNGNIQLISMFKKEQVKTVGIPKIEQLLYSDMKSENELYIWGQTNRIFPIKLALRILSNMLIQANSDHIDLEEFRMIAAKVAMSLRTKFEEISVSKRGKDVLWIGLPDSNPAKQNKSLERYKSQFIGYLRKDNIIEGPFGRLKFANIWIADNKKTYIGITKHGLEFAILENPILDKNDYNVGTLSNVEKDFYIKHILQYVPGESKMFNDILSLIKTGTSDLTSLNDGLSKIWPNTWTRELVNTYRSGTTARLVELGFVEKVKKGIKVEYKITQNGNDFIRRVR